MIDSGLLLTFGRNEIGNREIVAYFFYTSDDGVATLHPGVACRGETPDGLGIGGPADSKDAAGVMGLWRVAGLEQMALGTVQVAALQLDVGGIEVQHRVVRIHLDGSFKHPAVFRASGGIRLCQRVEVDIAQTGRIALEHAAYFVYVGVST